MPKQPSILRAYRLLSAGHDKRANALRHHRRRLSAQASRSAEDAVSVADSTTASRAGRRQPAVTRLLPIREPEDAAGLSATVGQFPQCRCAIYSCESRFARLECAAGLNHEESRHA